ncbi:ATP-binding protein [Natronorubrum texcoconense]|uniref:histidine kinase n=1 Tax=Natronorubrum texcoconense TaxID=1095776 RepID=A0A1G9ACJ5_9EURY|nr:ATP-binding protein [Natronorubrum texcoconense]SDK24260.1 His Kinase A (phospho-acceptor) domain-containing protein [Natronorubrum texcoconense]
MVRWSPLVDVIGGRGLVVALGGLYVAIAVGWAFVLIGNAVPAGSIMLVSLLIGVPAVFVCYGGYRLPRTDIHPACYDTIASRCLDALAVMVSILLLYHIQPADSLAGSFQTVLILTALSTAAGFAIGTNDAQAKTRARELEETVAQLRASNERLEQFAYAASHDLQEPLRMVSSYLQLIDRRYGDALDEDGEEFLEYAVDGADRMREMIDGLLAYSRIDTQGTPFEPVDLEDVFEDLLDDLQLKIEDCDAEVTFSSLPSVHGDREQLRQLFQNLLANALEYGGDAPRIRVTAERTGKRWTISVRDDGIGISLADQERIFEVFRRLHSYEEHAGTGIGLAICKRVVERHGGDITVDSEPGDGSTFSVTLPAAAEAETPLSM